MDYGYLSCEKIKQDYNYNLEQSYDTISERKKLRKIKQGHSEYIEKFTEDIIKKYYDEILRFCIYQLHDINSAYDITQETFFRFIKNINNIEYKNLKGYLLTIARNLCLDYWKLYKREQAIDFEDDSSIKMPLYDTNSDIGLNVNNEYEQVENSMILLDVLAKLPLEQREVVILRYYNDMKLSDISKIQGVNLSTVKSRLRLGIQRMKEFIRNSNE